MPCFFFPPCLSSLRAVFFIALPLWHLVFFSALCICYVYWRSVSRCLSFSAHFVTWCFFVASHFCGVFFSRHLGFPGFALHLGAPLWPMCCFLCAWPFCPRGPPLPMGSFCSCFLCLFCSCFCMELAVIYLSLSIRHFRPLSCVHSHASILIRPFSCVHFHESFLRCASGQCAFHLRPFGVCIFFFIIRFPLRCAFLPLVVGEFWVCSTEQGPCLDPKACGPVGSPFSHPILNR